MLCVDSSPTGLHKLHCLFLWHFFFLSLSLLKTQSLTKNTTESWIKLLLSLWRIVSIWIFTALWHEPRSHSRDPWTHNSVGWDDQITAKKTETHTHGHCWGSLQFHPWTWLSLCPTKEKRKGDQRRANRTPCVSLVHHLLDALRRNQISLFRAAFCWKDPGVVPSLPALHRKET